MQTNPAVEQNKNIEMKWNEMSYVCQLLSQQTLTFHSTHIDLLV